MRWPRSPSKSGTPSTLPIHGWPVVLDITKGANRNSTFDMNAQALDHMYVSPALARSKSVRFQHIHVNTWATDAGMVLDHDPSVALLDLCGRQGLGGLLPWV